MAPYAAEREVLIDSNHKEISLPKLVAPQADNHKFKISYFNVFAFGYWHVAALYGSYLAVTSASWATIIYSLVMMELSVLGVTASAHRLYAHKCYKAKMPLHIIMMILATFSGQYSVYNWVRDHRLHHKYSDTDADPHNATRGFFFSHIGWLLCEKHPEVKRRGPTIDMSDIMANPVLAFQKKYAAIWFTIVNYVLPTYLPMYFWGETLTNAWHLNVLRFVLSLNFICLVNSAAHMWGNKPYDKAIQPRENYLVKVLALGEGFHNYHHTFPWDYRAAEFGNETFNLTTSLIDFFAKIGWAYDMKKVDREVIMKRVARTGNGSHYSVCEETEEFNMAPYAAEREVLIDSNHKEISLPKLVAPQADNHKFKLSYFNVFAFGYWHAAALYGSYLAVTSAGWATIVYSLVMMELSVLGITASAHRLYAHKCYKAKMPLHIIMMTLATFSGQYSVYNWVRDHRLHHKYSDTDADPHNATRGFFFSHIGWLLCEKHPEVKKRGHTIDMSDIMANPVLAFQKKYAAIWFTMVNYVLPTYLPMYFWGETLTNAWHLNVLRFILSLNFICLVNSAAHMWGNKPFDKAIQPGENFLTIVLTLGEGFHNYHHTFPWDYRAAEFGNETFNLTTSFIDFFAKIGWAYDMKKVDRDVIMKRVARTGNGSHYSVCEETGDKNVLIGN